MRVKPATAPLSGGLDRQVLEALCAILAQHASVQRACLYGSRARGGFRTGSDIDLCLDAPGLELAEMLAIDTQIDDLLLPWKVDLTHWQTLDDPQLAAAIERDAVLIYP